jgi:signal transduction histidine kinase
VAESIAREVFGLLFETSSEAVFVVDRASLRIVAANVPAAEMLHHDVDSLTGIFLGDLLIDATRDVMAPGHYEDVALRGSDDYPVYTELHVAHVHSEASGDVAAFTARDTSERRMLERELVAKHSALFTAHADLERAHRELGAAKRELEAQNQQIALLAWRAGMGELVAGIAHHLNNPVGAMASTLRRLREAIAELPESHRSKPERQLGRVVELTRRIEFNVAAIVQASRSTFQAASGGPAMPPELASALSAFAEKLEDIPKKDPS